MQKSYLPGKMNIICVYIKTDRLKFNLLMIHQNFLKRIIKGK